MSTIANNPAKAGQLASEKEFFAGARFAVYAVHTRFEAVAWFVADAEKPDEATGLPGIVAQEESREAALARIQPQLAPYEAAFDYLYA